MIEFLSNKDNWALIIAGIVIVIIVVFQWRSFLSTRSIINNLHGFFPKADSLEVKKCILSPKTISDEKLLKEFLKNPKGEEFDEYTEDPVEVAIIVPPKDANSLFKAMIDKTNAYLCKNIGTSAELSVMTDICERQLDTIEEEAHNSLNVPLFLGLAGTFTGIILGLVGVDFKEIFAAGQTSNLVGLQHLLYGVVVAMCASLMGLGLTVYNSAIAYKGAVSHSSNKKDEY